MEAILALSIPLLTILEFHIPHASNTLLIIYKVECVRLSTCAEIVMVHQMLLEMKPLPTVLLLITHTIILETITLAVVLIR